MLLILNKNKAKAISAKLLDLNCQTPDFNSPTGPTKKLERHYNRVVVRSFVRCLSQRAITATYSWV